MKIKLEPRSLLFRILVMPLYHTHDEFQARKSRFQYKPCGLPNQQYYTLSLLGILNTLIGLSVEVKE